MRKWAARKFVPNRHRFHVGGLDRRRTIGGHGQLLVSGQLERPFGDLIPNRLMEALRVAVGRREQINHQQVDAMPDQVGCLADERSCALELVLSPGDTISMTATTSPCR